MDGTCIHKHKATTLWTNTVYSNTSSSKLAFCERVLVYVCMHEYACRSCCFFTVEARLPSCPQQPCDCECFKMASEQGKHRHFVDTVTLKIKNPHKNNVRSLESQKRTTHSHTHTDSNSLSFSPTLFFFMHS